jgi:exopolysaccharide biosynthesis polyprenyl glycosylphosphotransferase
MKLLALVEGGAIWSLCLIAALAERGEAVASSWGPAVGLATVLAAGWILALHYADGYEMRAVPRYGAFLRRLPRAVGLAVVPLTVAGAAVPGAGLPAVASLVAAIGVVPALRAAFYALIRTRLCQQKVLIIGTGPLAARVVEELEAQAPWCTILGLVEDPGLVGGPLDGYPLFGPLARLDAIIREVCPDRVIVALSERRRRLPMSDLLEARERGLRIEDGERVYERLAGKVSFEWLTPSHLIFSADFRVSPMTLAVGRVIGASIAAVALLVLAPVLAVIALAIVLDSPGPVFFVQDRVGLGGRRFRLVKFRSMHPVGRPRSEWARDNADRITRVGYWLRKFRLDELPQLLNVLRGEMALVGPRPHPASNFSLFVTVLRNTPECGEQIPYYSLRSKVRPGLTGWAQVRYRYANDLEEELEKMRYDLYYVKHCSPWLDLRILVDTIKTVLVGRGSTADGVTATMSLTERPRRPSRRAPQDGAVGRAEEHHQAWPGDAGPIRNGDRAFPDARGPRRVRPVMPAGADGQPTQPDRAIDPRRLRAS